MGRWAARLRGLGWKKGLAAIVVVLVVIGGAGGWLLTRGSGAAQAQPSTATVTSGTVQQTVSATGTVEAEHTADLDFAVSGTVTRVLVKAGRRVHRGQPLARVDDTALVAGRVAAQATLSAAEAQLTTDEDADASDVQIAADRTAIVSAEAGLASAVQSVHDAVLRATIAGTVTAVNVGVGDTVGSTSSAGSSSSGSGLGSSAATSSSGSTSSAVEIVSTRRFIVDATVAASDAGTLRKGMQAQVTVTGVSGTVYGTVASVGLVAQAGSSGAAVFPVTIDVTGARTDLYAGTSATASIIVKQMPNVLSVSSGAIHTDTDGSSYVEKVGGGSAVRTPVKIGTVYGPTTQVLSGLKAGDVVQVPGFAGFTRTGTGTQQGGFPGGGSFPSGGFPGGGSFGGFTGGTGLSR